VARIDPNGDAVIAGRASPGAAIELLRGAQVHDRAVADAAGNFVLVPKPLPPGNYDLTLRATEPDGKTFTSKNAVAVALDSNGEKKPVVALVAPDKPAVVLSKPAADFPASLSIEAVESESGGKLYVSGRTAPGATVRLYLNDAYIAAATASAEGRVTFVIQSGIKPGDYRVRLDQVDAAGKVQRRAEVPFSAKSVLAAAAPDAALPPKPPAAEVARAASPASPSAVAGPPARPFARPGPFAPNASPPTPPAAPAVVAAAPPASPSAAHSETAPAAVSRNVNAPSSATQGPPAPALPAGRTAAAPGAKPPDNAPRQIATTAIPTASPPPAEPEAVAPETPAAVAATRPLASASEDRKDIVVVPSIDTTLVVRGDSLWRISRATYGNGIRYTVIYSANRDQIRDPDLIYPGQIFVLPKSEPKS
jgi:nucleoid-associated protein YgaU